MSLFYEITEKPITNPPNTKSKMILIGNNVYNNNSNHIIYSLYRRKK